MMRYAPVDQAVELLAGRFRISPDIEILDLDSLLGRISAEDVVAPIDVPPQNRSAVDGYAVCSSGLSSASPNNPIPLRLKREKSEEISCDEATPISTGDPLPQGADAVVMLEDAEVEQEILYVMKGVSKYENVSRRGEDFEAGAVVIKRGTPLRPWHIASLSALNIAEAKAFRKLRVGIIATGSEVSEPGGEGFVFDSTSKLLASYLRELGYFEVRRYGIVKDDVEAISSAISEVARREDAIITTGGTGPGSRDLCVKALQKAGGDIIIRGMAMRPGRPTSVGELRGKPVFLLSGYPVAAFVGLRFIFIPFIEKALGIREQRLRYVFAELSSRVFGEAGLESFIRVRLSECGERLCAEPILLRGSGILSSLLSSGGFLRIPRNVEGYEAGEIVRVELA